MANMAWPKCSIPGLKLRTNRRLKEHTMSFLVIPVWPFGQVNLKRVEDSLFSERYGKVPTFVLAGIRVTWRRWR
jgi:hypothetical protein